MPILCKHYPDPEQQKLLLRKGVYPYEWVDSAEKFNETSLPAKECFYSSLTGEYISDEDYEYAQNVWKTFNMKTFRDYHEVYNIVDVLQLADIFENFRNVSIKTYKLDPAWYYTLPGYAWDVCLKTTKVKLELLTDMGMVDMFQAGIRGGISTIMHRYAYANNKYMRDAEGSSIYDPEAPSSHIIYLDANNL